MKTWLRRAAARRHGLAPRERAGSAPGVRWRVYTPPEGFAWDPSTVLHFLHPAEADERSWGEIPAGRSFYARLRARGAAAPTILSVSYGSIWTLMDTPAGRGHTAESYLELTAKRIEAGLGAPVKRRLLWGISQGGFNGARLILKDPRFFDAAVLSCPAFLPAQLYDDADIGSFIRLSGAQAQTVWWGVNELRRRVAGPEAWRRENPLAMAACAEVLPSLLIQASWDDEFGFAAGALEFCRGLEAQGLGPELSMRPGVHADIDTGGAADFLSARHAPVSPAPSASFAPSR